MKRLFFVFLVAVACTARGDVSEAEILNRLDLECAKGSMKACLTIINNNSKMSEIKQKLEEEKWIEGELLGASLLPLLLECRKRKTDEACEAFVQQVERRKAYITLMAIQQRFPKLFE
jgi:hypothetical protein